MKTNHLELYTDYLMVNAAGYATYSFYEIEKNVNLFDLQSCVRVAG